ncbi:expressed unknown protein [Seminavis robusta]|uniref:Uncharacterized protein n=1 Tax=Seminavis robusta TaxID=568900 RepID=A0A9N8DJC2_9STRA|nr:expressed unknown protein [Seminavis robusta]|eukprot:Sro159_g071940.1 n/a (186) ;mRNA; r:82942-83499
MLQVQQYLDPESININSPEVALTCKRRRSSLRRRTKSSTSGETNAKRRRLTVKTVRFADTKDEILPVFTASAKGWNSRDDTIRFRANVMQDVVYLGTLIMQNKLQDYDQTEHSSIGLELMCCSLTKRAQRRALSAHHIESVLRVQTLQREFGSTDVEFMRRASELCSEESKERAMSQAASLWKRP